MRDAAALEIRVAIAHGEQPIAQAQALQRGFHIVKQLHAVACRKEHFERLIGVGFVMTCVREQLRQRTAAQEREIVAALWELRDDAHAQRPQRLGVVITHDFRVPLPQPGQHRAFGGDHQRPYRPQGVVQIEAQDQWCNHRQTFLPARITQ